MKSITKTLVGTAAAGVLAVATATPAMANDGHRDRGIDAGDVLTGALIIGGIAAIAAIADNDDDRYDRRDYDRRDNRNSRRGSGDAAVQRCINAAERRAERYSGGRAEVTEIRDVDRERNGWEVKGRIAVQEYRYNGRNSRNSGWDEGRFTCDIRNGRVTDVNFRGIRSL